MTNTPLTDALARSRRALHDEFAITDPFVVSDRDAALADAASVFDTPRWFGLGLYLQGVLRWVANVGLIENALPSQAIGLDALHTEGLIRHLEDGTFVLTAKGQEVYDGRIIRG